MWERYYFDNIFNKCKSVCSSCEECQRNKIVRHTKSQVFEFLAPNERFQTIHLDIVGPLCETGSHRYLLTMIDRSTTWIEAEPMRTMSALEVAQTFYRTWISRFGTPLYVITDRGTQFESELFYHMSQIIGFTRLRTCAYKPSTNGLIERRHRTIKEILKSKIKSLSATYKWTEILPSVLMAIRMAPDDNKLSPFTRVTGTLMNVPTSFTLAENPTDNTCIQDVMRHLDPHRPRLNSAATSSYYVPKELHRCQYVWLRTDRIRKPLEAPYSGPYKVIEHGNKNFVIEVNGKNHRVSIDRLKPFKSIMKESELTDKKTQRNYLEELESHELPNTTISGRKIKPVIRFNLDNISSVELP